MRLATGIAVIASQLALGCATTGAVDAALHANLATLRKQIEQEQKQGKLDRGRVVELAQAVAEREVMSGSGRSGVRRIRLMRGCSKPMTQVLQARAERADDGGAEAALVLLSSGSLDRHGAFSEHAEAASGAWRAVAARAATRPEYFAPRRKFFTDVDERVRRAAFEAAVDAPAEADLEALLESARLDPDPLSRSLAARAVGASAGETAVLALVDRWDRADEDTRLSIIEAWSMPRAYQGGGERELIRAAESGSGIPALIAADALVRLHSAHAPAAVAHLRRAIAESPTEERRLAIRLAPSGDAEVQRLLKEAAKDADDEVKVMALARLLELPAERAAAQKALQKLAQAKSGVADQARAALSTQGDQSARPALLEALRAKEANERRIAALGLLRLGDYGSAAGVLGDEDATTRATLACSILAREQHSR